MVPPMAAVVKVDGAASVRRATGDGTFVIRGLDFGDTVLRFSVDDDGDGVA